MRTLNTLVLFLFSSLSVVADVRVPRLFSDQMILQQQTHNAVWGFADPGEKVTVEASWGDQSSTTANADGDWRLFVKTP